MMKKADIRSRKDHWAWNLFPLYHFSVRKNYTVCYCKKRMRLDMRVRGWKDGPVVPCPFLGETEHVHLAMFNLLLSWYPAGKNGHLPAQNSSVLDCSKDANHHLLFYNRVLGESEFLLEALNNKTRKAIFLHLSLPMWQVCIYNSLKIVTVCWLSL